MTVLFVLIFSLLAEDFVELDTASCTNYYVTPDIGVNVRSGPGTGYSVTGALPKGATVCVVSISNGWAKLNTGKYVSSQYIAKSSPSPTPSCTNYYVTASIGLNVRSGPGTGYSVTGSLAKGATVCVVSISNGWAKLNNGKYVSSQYISKSSPSPSPTPTPTPSSGDKRKCRTFWNKYNSTAYPTRAQYASGLRSLVGKHVSYTQGGARWNGINKGYCPGSVPDWADCSSFTTWAYWTAFGGLSDIVNGQSWSAGYTGTMQSKGTYVSMGNCQQGDIILYPGHVASYVGSSQVVNYGATGPVKLLNVHYRTGAACYRFNFPFGKKF